MQGFWSTVHSRSRSRHPACAADPSDASPAPLLQHHALQALKQATWPQLWHAWSLCRCALAFRGLLSGWLMNW